ncbi:MAG: hypothetical protein M3335_10145, partial [Actinomycetota bacterium]|nr:hypothetical protein [Actinomycetota bacterium]
PAIMEALEMEKPMDSWNDDRLDELSRRMDEGFKQVNSDMKEGFARVDREMKEGFTRVDREMKEGFARVDREMKEGFTRVDRDMKEGFAELRGEMGHLGARFDRLLNTLVLIAWGFAGTLVAALVAVLAAAWT